MVSRRELFVRTHVPGLDDIIPGFPEGGLILVAGLPGTGKTVFGMTFIYRGASVGDEPGVYISTCESKERFLQLASKLGMDFGELMRKGLVEHLWIPLTAEEGVSMSVNTALERVESLGARRLVIDSFTALKQQFKSPGEARIFLQTLLSKILEKLRCTTILIKEGEALAEAPDFEEYVVDGVLCLRKGYFERRPIRWLEIMKLRGAELRNTRLICTIKDGFKVISPTSIFAPTRIPEHGSFELWPPDPPGAYTTGIPGLDRELGGYQPGSTVLVEIDPRLTFREYNVIVGPTMAGFVLKGRHQLTIPSGGVSPDLLRESFRGYGVSEQEFLERHHIFYERSAVIEKAPNVIEVDLRFADDVGRRITELMLRLVKETGEPVLAAMGVDRIIRFAGEEGLKLLSIVQDLVRALRCLMLWIVKPTMPWLIERLAPIADVHLKITRRHGCMLIYGVKPRTPLYAIQLDPRKSPPIPELVSIV